MPLLKVCFTLLRYSCPTIWRQCKQCWDQVQLPRVARMDWSEHYCACQCHHHCGLCWHPGGVCCTIQEENTSNDESRFSIPSSAKMMIYGYRNCQTFINFSFQRSMPSSMELWIPWEMEEWSPWGRMDCPMMRWDTVLHQTGKIFDLSFKIISWIIFRKLPPVPGTNSNYNTIDRIKKGRVFYLYFNFS